MEKIYIIGGLLSLFLVYKLFTLLIFLILKAYLKKGNLDSFTRILGRKYRYRRMMNGLKRYKWSKIWINVKASFDEDGNLIFEKVKPGILKFKSEVSFTI